MRQNVLHPGAGRLLFHHVLPDISYPVAYNVTFIKSVKVAYISSSCRSTPRTLCHDMYVVLCCCVSWTEGHTVCEYNRIIPYRILGHLEPIGYQD